jgi:hypothetical protein
MQNSTTGTGYVHLKTLEPPMLFQGAPNAMFITVWKKR